MIARGSGGGRRLKKGHKDTLRAMELFWLYGVVVTLVYTFARIHLMYA